MTPLVNLATKLHDHNVKVGWWDPWPLKVNRYPTAMGLVMTELAEAYEGARKDLMDDHLPHHKMLHVELADALIRLLDLAAGVMDPTMFCKLDQLVGLRAQKIKCDMDLKCDTVFERLWFCMGLITNPDIDDAIVNGITGVVMMCNHLDIDIFPIITEKHEYNVHRSDHKRENREKEGGKKV